MKEFKKSLERNSVFLILILFSINLFSQKKVTSTLSTNLTGIPFNDVSLYYEYTKTDSIKIGTSVGYMIGNRWLHRLGTEVNDDELPLLAYFGPEFRLYFMRTVNWKSTIKRKNNFYFGPELLFKYLYYGDTKFVDYIDVGENEPVFYTRNEKTFVTGLELKFCKDYNYKKFFMQLFWSVGCRLKFRDINTTETHSEGLSQYRPVGHKTENIIIPVFNIGLKLGSVLSKK